MNPTRCKQEHEVSAAIEGLEERYRILNEDDREFELPDSWKMTALQAILCEKVQKNVEHREREFKTYDELRGVSMKWAINKKIENECAGFDPMDCNLTGSKQQEDWWNAEWPTPGDSAQPNIDVDYP